MAISLADIKRNTIGPPRIVLYGVPGIGKTSLSACAPKPLFLCAEDGLGKLDVPFVPIRSHQDARDAVQMLVTEEHEFQTVVLDSADRLEPMLWDYVSAQNGKSNIEDFGWQKGQKSYAPAEWRSLLDGLDILRESKGAAIIVLAHSDISRFEAPDTDPYDRYQMRLNKYSEAVLADWADAILFMNYKVTAVTSGPKGSERKRGVGNGDRIIHTVERPQWCAKNRYSLPHQIAVESAPNTGNPAADMAACMAAWRKAWAIIEHAVMDGVAPLQEQTA